MTQCLRYALIILKILLKWNETIAAASNEKEDEIYHDAISVGKNIVLH